MARHSATGYEVLEPFTIEEFLKRPTKIQWYDEMSLYNWWGPDGSSWSFDDIMGIRIGSTNAHWEDSDLPANFHDWLYQLGRRYRLPERYRKAADRAYRDGCLARTSHLIGGAGWLARRICHARYRALRALGWKAWRIR